MSYSPTRISRTSESTFALLVVASMVISLLLPISPIANATGSESERPDCPISSAPGRTIVEFPDSWDLRDDVESRREFGPMNTFIEKGTYDITLVSWDDGHPGGSNQPHEQYYIEGLNNGDVVLTSTAIGDLPTSKTTRIELVDVATTFTKNINGIKALHAYPPTTPTANSIQAICAAFDKIPNSEPAECKLELFKSVDKNTANVGDVLTYRLEFENTGTANCTGGGVRIQDDIPDGVKYISESHASSIDPGYGGNDVYESASEPLRWDGNTVRPGDSGWIEWKAEVTEPNACGSFDINNIARITAKELNNFKDWTYSNEVTTSIAYACPTVCPLTELPNRTIVTFPDWRLRSDITSQRSDGPMNIPTLLAGVYNITVVSRDKSHPAGGTQPQEQWYLSLRNNGSEIFASNATTDLPDSQTQLAEKINTRAYVGSDINSLMSLHAAPKNAPTANSITPSCVAFDRQPNEPTITLVKKVINDDGGTSTIGDFTLKLNTNVVTSGVANAVSPGTYTASEVNLPGYSAGNWSGDCSANGTVTVNYGSDAVCEITNNDNKKPTITLIKNVINNNDGTLEASDFTLRIDSTDVSTGDVTFVDPGTYTVSEVQNSGYDAGGWSGDCSANGTVTVNYGDNAVCEITNDDKPAPPENPTITLVKTVINNDGGTASIGDFTLKLTETGVSKVNAATSGIPLVVSPSTYLASEINLPGYNAGTWGGDCNPRGYVTVGYGDNAICTITNDDVPSTSITLVKKVINDDGGTSVVSDFVLKIDATSVLSGVAEAVLPGTYTATELNLSGYTASNWSGDCAADGTVTVNYGDNITCFITNNDKGGGGGSSPRLVITKTVDPTFTTPGTTVTYTVVVTNKGYASAADVTMTDTLPEPYFSYSDGTAGREKTWSLGNLAQNESETTTFNVDISVDALEASYTNTATTKAKNNGPVSATADVEVRTGGVLGEEFFPKLEIEKTVSPPFTTPGGSALYTIVVRNIGEAVAENVTVDDVMPKEFTEITTGNTTLNWNIGDLVIGQEWSVTYEANVSADTVSGRSYRNIASANANNADKVLDPADIEVREGEVLGFDTIPETGAFDGATGSLATITLSSLIGFMGAAGFTLRRRSRTAADRLTLLSRKLR